MRLQELLDDLGEYLSNEDRWPAVIVARRVADLFESCPSCEGSGRFVTLERGGLLTKTTRLPCSNCGSTGVVYSAKGRELSPGNALARYLFGEA